MKFTYYNKNYKFMKINDHIKFIYVKDFFYYKNQNKFKKRNKTLNYII